VEADHILGDLLRRAPEPEPRSLLRIAYVHLKTYEVRRGRESATGSGREVAVGVQLSEEGL
jgi:2-dehydropantoate 2-reductase